MNILRMVDGIFLILYNIAKIQEKIHAISDVENLSNFKKFNIK